MNEELQELIDSTEGPAVMIYKDYVLEPGVIFLRGKLIDTENESSLHKHVDTHFIFMDTEWPT